MSWLSITKSKWFIAVVALGVMTTVLTIASLFYLHVRVHEVIPFRQVVLGSENAGVDLQLAYRPYDKSVMPSEWWLMVRTPQRRFPLQSLEQLKGAVTIRTKEDALRFVRLRTCPAITVTWPTRDEYEVMTFAEAKQQYLYGLTAPASDSTEGSGWNGVIASSAFIHGGFQAPMVQVIPLGFQITRWLFQPEQTLAEPRQSAQVLKVREIVGIDGSYRRIILTSHSPPALPGTSWAASTPWCCLRIKDARPALWSSAKCAPMS